MMEAFERAKNKIPLSPPFVKGETGGDQSPKQGNFSLS
jgi:hypothetical protein